jgi:hypothetical protein
MPEMMKCFVMHGIGQVGLMDKPTLEKSEFFPGGASL